MANVHRLSVFGPRDPVRFSKHDDENVEDQEEKEEEEEEDCHLGIVINNSDARNNAFYSVNSNVSCNVVDYVHRREHGSSAVRPISFRPEYGTRHIIEHNLLHEREVKLPSINKVFCSTWLSDRQILFGTKCNKLLILDLITNQYDLIPSLTSSQQSKPPDPSCGIHSIQINPSHTLLATGACNVNDVAVYQLPSFDPVAVGEGAHNDWIFDIVWLDDEFFITGSRDTKVSLWHMNEKIIPPAINTGNVPMHSIMSPVIVKSCKNAEKIRALSFNHKYQEFVALSLNGYIHAWDLHTFKQKSSRRLPQCLENVCLATRADCSLYAVGSKSHLTLHDSRTLRSTKEIPTKMPGSSIRSISFSNNNIITLSTGTGSILFYECRAAKYIESNLNFALDSLKSPAVNVRDQHSKPVILQASRGWVYPDELYIEVFRNQNYNPAIYTHCYDPSGTRLFAAGGPLPSSLYGNYAGLWQ